MSIRPIDYTSMISKSQEVSKARQIETDRHKVQITQEIVQQEKQIRQDIKKVRNTDKSQSLIINRNKKDRDKNLKDKDKKQGKKKKEKDESIEQLGGTIDIKI